MDFAVFYLLIAAVFAIPTIIEGSRKNIGWGGNRLAGLAMCLAWPAVAGAAIIAASRTKLHN